MSAALNSPPANHSDLPSSASRKSSWLRMFGMMKPSLTLRAMARAIGFAKKGMGPVSTLSNTSFISSGGISEPSA